MVTNIIKKKEKKNNLNTYILEWATLSCDNKQSPILLDLQNMTMCPFQSGWSSAPQ